VLNLHLFRNLVEVRETTYWWMIDYNEYRPHDALGDVTPSEYIAQNADNATSQLST
jgi:putative transposase